MKLDDLYNVHIDLDNCKVDKDTGELVTRFYALEQITYEKEFFGIITSTGIENDELVDYKILFTDVTYKKPERNSYDKDLFDAIYEEALLNFKAMIATNKAVG